MEKQNSPLPNASSALRRGWTTGACATAATKAALLALLGEEFPDPVTITLPKGETPSFALAREVLAHEVLAHETLGDKFAEVGIIKDAGDDPDVTHNALIISRVKHGAKNSGIVFCAGEGVGTVTKPGLPIDVGNAAINPVPRQMMRQVVEAICKDYSIPPDIEICISIPGGEELAQKTWNPRLGIVGGLSVLGTTGIVHPFSCSAWIHSIHRGIDVSRANGISHVLGATGSTSETAAKTLYDFPDEAILDMGDFAGGVLKYLRQNPIEKLTLAGGFAKFVKLAQGHLDLHSSASQVDMEWLSQQLVEVDAKALNHNFKEMIRDSNTAMEALEITRKAGIDLASTIALKARNIAVKTLRDAPVSVEVLIVSRDGKVVARTPFSAKHESNHHE